MENDCNSVEDQYGNAVKFESPCGDVVVKTIRVLKFSVEKLATDFLAAATSSTGERLPSARYLRGLEIPAHLKKTAAPSYHNCK